MVRGKIVIRKIDCSKSRQVTFFKRRAGLLKKAKELSILCDAQIGLIIFSCTGKLYEYASTSMKSILEKYGSVKQEIINNPQCMSALEIQFLRGEAATLKQQISRLQESHRQMMGEGLSNMSLEDLKGLETKLYTSLKNVRARKDQVFEEEAKGLKEKADQMERENKKLWRKLSQVIQYNTKSKGDQVTSSVHPLPVLKPFEFLTAEESVETSTLHLPRTAHASIAKAEDGASDEPTLNLKLSPPGSEL